MKKGKKWEMKQEKKENNGKKQKNALITIENHSNEK